jgi:sugar phosphate permease
MPRPRHRHCKPNSGRGTIDRHACATKRQIGPKLIERHVADATVIKPSAGRLHYAWVIAAVTFVVVLLTAGVRSVPGVLIVPLEEEFHWSRATISFAIGINLLLYGLVGPFAAALMDRFGVRRTTTLALAATALGVALSPAMHEPWQLVLLWGVVVGVGCGFIGPYLAALIAARWFHQRQGVVIGVLTAASAAGQLVFLPTMAALVTYAGWRVMSLSLAASVMIFVPLVALLLRERPEDLGLTAYGSTRAVVPVPAATGNPMALMFRALADGARSRDFWLIAGSYFICGASTNGLIATHLIPACVDHGLGEVVGASLLAATGVFAFIGGTLSGWLSDRCDNRFLLFWYYGLRGLSLMYLPFAFDMSFYGLTLFSVFYGLDWIASVPPTVRLLVRVMGTARIGIMVAWITAIHMVGGALAAYLGGLLRITFGSYLEAFMLSGLLCIAAALMVLLIGAGRRESEPVAVPAE